MKYLVQIDGTEPKNWRMNMTPEQIEKGLAYFADLDARRKAAAEASAESEQKWGGRITTLLAAMLCMAIGGVCVWLEWWLLTRHL